MTDHPHSIDPKFGKLDLLDLKIDYKPVSLFPKPTEWTCYLFGNRPGGSGLAWHLTKEEAPNRFVRFMMRICFGIVTGKQVCNQS